MKRSDVIPKAARWLALLAAAAIPTTLPANADETNRVDEIYIPVNKVAADLGLGDRLLPLRCARVEGQFECLYTWSRPGMISALGDEGTRQLQSIAVYLPTTKQLPADVANVVAVFLRAFSPQLDQSAIGKALASLADGAAGPDRRGTVKFDAVSYALLGNDGRHVRLYVTLEE